MSFFSASFNIGIDTKNNNNINIQTIETDFTVSMVFYVYIATRTIVSNKVERLKD